MKIRCTMKKAWGHVARPSPAASSGTVSVLVPISGTSNPRRPRSKEYRKTRKLVKLGKDPVKVRACNPSQFALLRGTGLTAFRVFRVFRGQATNRKTPKVVKFGKDPVKVLTCHLQPQCPLRPSREHPLPFLGKEYRKTRKLVKLGKDPVKVRAQTLKMKKSLLHTFAIGAMNSRTTFTRIPKDSRIPIVTDSLI